MKVLKFGGTSVGSFERIRKVCEIVSDDSKKIVVLSAFAGTTDFLYSISQSLSKGLANEAIHKILELETKYQNIVYEMFPSDFSLKQAQEIVGDHFIQLRSLTGLHYSNLVHNEIVSKGELLSTQLIHLYLKTTGVSAHIIPALQFMRVDQFDEPDFLYIQENLIRKIKEADNQNIYITQGFICRNYQGDITNLKRGGSDYTASIIGAAINASEIQIWSDIDGFHNNDPRFVEDTEAIQRLSFDEAAELAYFGAKIMHPTSILPAQKKGIPVWLKNTFNPTDAGTVISSITTGKSIKAIAAKDGITSIKIKSARMLMAYGFLRQVFEVFEKYQTPIDVITTSEVAISLTIDDNSKLAQIGEELMKFGEIEIHENQSIVCVVGDFKAETHSVASRVISAVKDVPIRMISYGGSQYNISVVVNTADKIRALNNLHQNLFRKTYVA